MFSHQSNTYFSKNTKKIDFSACSIFDNPFPYLPPMVELNHLYPNNKILSDEMIKDVKEWFRLNHDKNIFRTFAKNGMAVIVLMLQHPELQQSNLYAIYLGNKPKSYQLSEYQNQQGLNKWIMYIEVTDIKDQFKYIVVDSISGKTISDVITSDQLPKLKELNQPYKIGALEKIASHILKITSERGHTYPKKILGSGSFGTVRLMLDLETGEWCAMKKMPYSQPGDSAYLYNDENVLKVEINNLTLLNRSLGVIDDPRHDTKQIKFVGMKLVPGMNLHDFKNSNPKLKQIQWLTLFVSLIECTLKFYQSGFLHLDIKPGNVLYNKNTKEMSFVDFGFLASGQCFKSDYSYGTEGYIPPEFDIKCGSDFRFYQSSTMPTVNNLHLFDAKIAYIRFEDKFLYINKSQQLIETIPLSGDVLNELDLLFAAVKKKLGGSCDAIIFDDTLTKIESISGHTPSYLFNEKSMVYNVGLIIAEMLDLDQSNWNNSRIINDDDKRFIRNGYIKDLPLKKDILDYLKLMTNNIISSRPTLNESLQFFKSKILQLPEILCHTRKIGILNITEYLSLNAHDQSEMQDRLKLMDEIWFIDRDSSHSNHYYQIRREFEKAEINIGNHIFTTYGRISERKLLHAITKIISSDSINAYFYITNAIYHTDKIASLNNSRVSVLFHDTLENNVKTVNEYLYQNTLLSEQYEMLIFLLSNKKEHLSEKYGVTNRVAKERMAQIELVIGHFKQCNEKNILSHSTINDILGELSNTLLSTSTHLMEVIHSQNAYAMNLGFNH